MERPAYLGPSLPLNPYWVSGFIDGDGSFFVSKTNQVTTVCSMGLNVRETPLLLAINKYFGDIGKIYHTKKQSVHYAVTKVIDLRTIIIPHFDTYGLRGNKLSNSLI
jgi:hypothetical protein